MKEIATGSIYHIPILGTKYIYNRVSYLIVSEEEPSSNIIERYPMLDVDENEITDIGKIISRKNEFYTPRTYEEAVKNGSTTVGFRAILRFPDGRLRLAFIKEPTTANAPENKEKKTWKFQK